jgi:transcriptional regulator GlxA family with amidase domain
MTIDRFRLVQRVELARLLLSSTTLPIREIGARVGMPDAQHFNKVFRSVVGLPPSACRRDASL